MTSTVLSIENFLVDNLLNARQSRTNTRGGTGIFLLCGVFVCLGLGFIIYGAHLSFTDQYSPQAAATMTGILSLSFAILIAGFVYAVGKYQDLQMQKSRLKIFENAKVFLSSLDDEIGDPIRNHPKASIAIAALTGFLLEDRIF
jgi:hypothetical protein